MPTTLKLDVAVTRGALVESIHDVHAAVVDASGAIVAVAGDPNLTTYWRSCAKPLQVMPLVRAGGLERYGWGDDELALACASHGGEPEHVAIAARMLASLELEEGDLACGVHEPMTRRGAQLARDAGTPVGRLHNNCSGKHAAMLARARLAGWPTQGYERGDHPVQIECRDEVARWARVATNDLVIGVDGCGVSVFALSLRAMAHAYADLGAQYASGVDPAARIVRAMASRPFLVGGTDRFDTIIAEETNGRVIAKVGAEGVHSVMVPGRGLGLALKVHDGALRAQHVAVVAALSQLGVLTAPIPERLLAFAHRPIKNTRGEIVGEIRARDDSIMPALI
ncbi:MAG TPA: asparaginase [Gemmatimonadaceae bacterium]|nr:asparaginase [Gemmatimonadaceae bacterium]